MVETAAWAAAETFALGAQAADDIPIHFVPTHGLDANGPLDDMPGAWRKAHPVAASLDPWNCLPQGLAPCTG